MNKITEHDTCERLLAIGELPCMQCGFTGMGLGGPLKTTEIPKGLFCHYFRSRGAFGIAMLECHYVAYHRRLAAHFDTGTGSYHDCILACYQETLNQLSQHGTISGYLAVKLSVGVCNLSGDMRIAMDKDARHIIVPLAQALEKGQTSHYLSFVGEPSQQAQVLYALWLGTNLQAKISRSATPPENALTYIKNIITTPVI